MSMRLRLNSLTRLAQADMVFYLLPALMALLVAGTLAQRSMGLYAAHKMFFGSFVIWAGPVPLPGGYMLIGFLTLNLAIKFIFNSEWSWRKAGIILSHLGVLVLLVGGLLTAVSAKEGFMIIGEGEGSPYIYDYHNRELSVFMGDYASMTIPFQNFINGQNSIDTLPFNFQIQQACSNCAIIKREDAPEIKTPLQGMARFMALETKSPATSPEENMAGIGFEISGLDKNQDGFYIAFEAMPEPITLKRGKQNYKIMMGRQQRTLPFRLELIDFKRETYPGMDKARAYSSAIIVHDGNLQWPALISMNTPLRYKGYTFYQSSFEQTENGEMTVLSVVENKGRLFPYIGTLLVTAGLLLHIFITLQKRRDT